MARLSRNHRCTKKGKHSTHGGKCKNKTHKKRTVSRRSKKYSEKGGIPF